MNPFKAIFLSILIISVNQIFVASVFAKGPYREYEEIMTDFMDLINNYPEKIEYIEIGKTVDNNSIIMFKIGNSSNSKVLYTGAIHGWETQGSEILYIYAKWLLTSNSIDANFILNNTQTLLIPAVNVDNYNYDRENKNEVDLNRNFVTNWQYSGSSDPESEWYRGPYPLSEPESQTLIEVFKEYKPKYYVDLHFPGGPYYAGSRYRDEIYYTNIIKDIETLSNKNGVSPYEYRGQFRASGLAFTDAATLGITSFLLELTGDPVIPLEQVVTEVFPRFLPITIVLSQYAQNNIPEISQFYEDNFYEFSQVPQYYQDYFDNIPEFSPKILLFLIIIISSVVLIIKKKIKTRS